MAAIYRCTSEIRLKNDQNYYDYTKIFVGYIIARKNTMLENMAGFFTIYFTKNPIFGDCSHQKYNPLINFKTYF